MINPISCVRFYTSRCVAIITSNVPGSGLSEQKPVNAYVNRLRKRDREKRIAVVLILLWTLPGNMTIRADENRVDLKPADEDRQQVESVNEQDQNASLLDGKRLFFNQEQRRGSKSRVDTFAGSLSSDLLSREEAAGSGPGSSSVAAVEQQTSIVVAEPVERTGKIHYQARVEGSEEIRVIVNGLPCDAVNRSAVVMGASGIALNCKSMTAKRLQLLLLADGASLQVMDGKRVKGIITPGGSL